MKKSGQIIACLVFLFCISWGGNLFAANGVPFQGYLVGTDGTPLDGSYLVTFTMTDCDSGTTVWTEDQSISVSAGAFNTTLGDNKAFPSDFFEHDKLCLAMAINGDTIDTGLDPVPLALHADTAGEATYADSCGTANALATTAAGSGVSISSAGVVALSPTQTWTGAQTLTKSPTAAASATDATLIINPTAAVANGNLMVVKDNGTVRFSVDKEGDTTIAGNITLSSLMSCGSLTTDASGLVSCGAAASTTASSFVGTGSTTNAVDLATAEVSGTLPDANVADDITIGASGKSHNFSLGATNLITIDAATTDTTLTSGVVSMIVDSSTNSAIGLGINIKNTSTATSGQVGVTGITVTPVQSGNGAGGSHSVIGVNVASASGTGALVGTQSQMGLRVGNQGVASTESAYGIWVDTQTGSTANYAAIFQGGNVGVGTITPGSALDVKGTLRLSGATSGYVGLAPAAAAGAITYTLPSADGTAGQFLRTDGAATLSWGSATGTGSITTTEILDGTIVAADLATDAVASSKILDATIVAADIADGAVTSAKILDGEIVNADINVAAAIAYSKLNLANSIAAGDIATGAVTSAKILDGTIATGDIAAGAITTTEILDATIAAGDIATGAVTSAKILDGTIAATDIANDVIGPTQIDETAAYNWSGGETVTKTISANSNTTNNVEKITLTTPADSASTNTHQGLDIATTIGNATAGTNTANLINIENLTGDADVSLNAIKIGNLTATGANENAINIGTGWDNGLTSNSPLNITVGSTAAGNAIYVAQSGTVDNSVSITAMHTGAVTGTAYAVWGQAQGASTTNIALYGSATGATTNYGLKIGAGDAFISARGDMRFADADSSNWGAIEAPATITTNYTLTLPADDGNANQVLTTDGSGVLSWSTPSTPAPTTATYLTLSNDATLSAERVLTAGTAMSFSDSGANGTETINFLSTGVGTTSWGSGSDFTWTFNGSGAAAADPTMAIGNATVQFGQSAVGIGVAPTLGKLHVDGSTTMTGIYGTANGAGLDGVDGINSGGGIGVFGQTSSTSATLSGISGKNTGGGAAGYFTTIGATTLDSYGINLSDTATSSTNSIKKYGIKIDASGAWSGSSAPVYGIYSSAAVASGSNSTYGLYGVSSSSVNSTGVYGTSTTGIGVWGEATGDNTIGVKGGGFTDADAAFFDASSTSSTAATQYAVYGAVNDTGVVTAGTDQAYGFYGNVVRTGATGGTINSYGGYFNVQSDNAGAGTSNAYGLRVNMPQQTTDNQYGLYVQMAVDTGGAGYGLYVDSGTGAGTEYAAYFTNGNVGIDTATPIAALDVQRAITATGGLAKGVNFAQTLNAAANNDQLIALRIAPTYNDGAQTGVGHLGISVNTGSVRFAGRSVTIADNGNGATAAAYTLEPANTTDSASVVKITCNDAQGCDVTMGETSTTDGELVTVFNVGTNTVNFADTASVSELAGAFAAGQYDSISMVYITDRWVETARSNN